MQLYPPNRFTTRLSRATSLSAAQLHRLDALCSDVRDVPADHELAREGTETDRVHILLDGWAARQKRFGGGRRRLPTLLVPGDICDIDALHIARLDYDVVTMTACRVAAVPRKELLRLIDEEPAMGHTLMWLALVDNALVTTWVGLLAQASARTRIAHLFCELLARLDAVDLVEDNGFSLPLTQEELSDVAGLTPVHVNRMLQSLRRDAVIRLDQQRLAVPDRARLHRAGDFTPAYLHLEGMRR